MMADYDGQKTWLYAVTKTPNLIGVGKGGWPLFPRGNKRTTYKKVCAVAIGILLLLYLFEGSFFQQKDQARESRRIHNENLNIVKSDSFDERDAISEGLNFEVKKLSTSRSSAKLSEASINSDESSSYYTPFPDESLLVSDLFDGSWIHENPDLCTKNKGKGGASLLALVVSAPANFEARDAIRQSWAIPATNGKNLALAFLVGSSQDQQLQQKVLKESESHGDMVVSVMQDSYRNMTLKILAGLDWSQRHCPSAKHVLKADDDVFVQLPRLSHFLRQVTRRQPLMAVGGDEGGGARPMIYGLVASGWHPGRVVGHKYYISPRQFPGETLPDFVTGPSYVISAPAIKRLLPLAWSRPYLHLEDVFITGILAEAAGVPRRLAAQLRNNAVKTPAKFLGCTIARTISIHQIEPSEQLELYNMARNPQCGAKKNKKKNVRL